jgi:hypothetical protein
MGKAADVLDDCHAVLVAAQSPNNLNDKSLNLQIL